MKIFNIATLALLILFTASCATDDPGTARQGMKRRPWHPTERYAPVVKPTPKQVVKQAKPVAPASKPKPKPIAKPKPAPKPKPVIKKAPPRKQVAEAKPKAKISPPKKEKPEPKPPVQKETVTPEPPTSKAQKKKEKPVKSSKPAPPSQKVAEPVKTPESMEGLPATKSSSWLSRISFDFYLGAAHSFDSELTIEFDNHDDVHMAAAQWDNHPFEGAPYYGWRLGFWGDDGSAWELELIHHKLYLANNPDEIDELEITHGYNLLTVNHVRDYQGFDLRAGLGWVLAHPELKAYGRYMEESHFLDMEFIPSGPTMQIGVGKRFRVARHLYGALEGKFTASYAVIELEEATITAPNIAAHVVFGIGFDYTLE